MQLATSKQYLETWQRLSLSIAEGLVKKGRRIAAKRMDDLIAMFHLSLWPPILLEYRKNPAKFHQPWRPKGSLGVNEPNQAAMLNNYDDELAKRRFPSSVLRRLKAEQGAAYETPAVLAMKVVFEREGMTLSLGTMANALSRWRKNPIVRGMARHQRRRRERNVD